MEPVFMALGEACGIAAQKASEGKVEVRGVNVPDMQRELLKRGAVLLYECHPLRPNAM